MSLPTDDRDPVDVLAEEFADRLRRGERPSVSDFALQHPEHAEQIRQVLPAVAQMEQLKQFRKTTVGAESVPDRFGDFRIVKELGRGGMGVVYEAMQESLGRRVALKVLAGHAQMDPQRRERFIREAKAAAKLHHTNIVPVFGVGEQDGVPYYVMQLIPGCGLNTLVSQWRRDARRETKAQAAPGETTVYGSGKARKGTDAQSGVELPPLPPVAVAGDWSLIASIGAQTADALHYAHQHGVLHRDVKPANLLLDEHGEVWVVDFGLAKLANYRGLTATGHIVGTLQYMAPEAFKGEADARGDVYGLGATLYELLTLEPPYDGDSPARILKQIADTSPIPPHRLNPSIPRDLETIVLKAMAKEPSRRYATARELADDLEAFLQDEPIRARRESLPERAWRWARHHPAVAALSCCTVAALLLAAILGWTGYASTQAALKSEKIKRDEAEDASRKLRRNLQMSLEAFSMVFEAAGGDEFRPGFGPRGPSGPNGPPLPFRTDAADKAAVLEAILNFYDRFARENETDTALRFEAAKANRRVGELHQWLNRHDKAEVAYRRSLELLRSVQAERPNDADVRYELMVWHSNAPVGPGGAEPQLIEAARLGEAFTEAPRRWSVATVYLKLGYARELALKTDQAEADYRKGIALAAAEPGGPERPPQLVMEQLLARRQLASLLSLRQKDIEARDVLIAGIDEARPLSMNGGPQNRPPREAISAALRQLADIHQRLGDFGAANRALQESQRFGEGHFPGGGPFPKGPRKQ
jgi:serine/threonine protein kinase